MPTLDEKDRAKLKDKDFAYIEEDGDRKLPVHDEEHARNAISRFDQTDFESGAAKKRAAKKVLDAAEDHAIEVDPSDDVVKAAKKS